MITQCACIKYTDTKRERVNLPIAMCRQWPKKTVLSTCLEWLLLLYWPRCPLLGIVRHTCFSSSKFHSWRNCFKPLAMFSPICIWKKLVWMQQLFKLQSLLMEWTVKANVRLSRSATPHVCSWSIKLHLYPTMALFIHRWQGCFRKVLPWRHVV